ncbi:YcaO-like family protein [Brevibacillus daliensis]|uniref:YcaO-like family protein n=1 Tax=Brevibacillus daliensis TaxID=2892995 RepID=UPI001E387EFB|nr:YcaO-like family protein [Brevibacillus daliensis]
MDESGLMGPTNCGGVAEEKILSFKKAFSESIERRSLNFGALTGYKDGRIQVFNLIKNEITSIPQEYSCFRLTTPVIDTTGTAVHFNPDEALYNALAELLEKNSVFLLWYGKLGRKLTTTHVDTTAGKSLLFEDGTFTFFIQESFYPLLVVVCIFESETSPVRFKVGIGSGFLLEQAINKSVSEAYMLGLYYEKLYYQAKSKHSERSENTYDSLVINLLNDKKCIEHVRSLDNLPLAVEKEFSQRLHNSLGVKQKISMVVKNLPKWIEDLYVMNLKQLITRELVAVKVFSPQLLSHIPVKEFIDVDIRINKEVLQFTKERLLEVPDCPFI